MNDFTITGASGRFEDSHADLLEEIRLMVEADRHAERPVETAPRPSFLTRLFQRPAALRRAA